MEVLIVVAICAVVEKKKKQPGFISQIQMLELKCLVILWGGVSVSYFFLVFSLFPPSYFFYFSSIQSHCRMCQNRASKIKALLAG